MKYGTFKYGQAKYGAFPLTWKPWSRTDNYAANGTAELERLLSNAETLSGILSGEFGFEIDLSLPALSGFATLPFAALMNQVEAAVNCLKQFDINHPASRSWAPGHIPTFADPNRWENTGELVEENILRGRTNFTPCGTFSAGGIF